MKKMKVPFYGRIRALMAGKKVYEAVNGERKRLLFSTCKEQVMKNFPPKKGWKVKQVSKFRSILGK